MVIQKKSQGSIEFMLLVGAVTFFFILLFFGIQQNIANRLTEEKRILTQNIALQIQDEIEMATKASEGYYREFSIPSKIKELDYEAILVDSLIYVKTSDDQHAVVLPILNVTGQMVMGTNVIQKKGGQVLLNP